MDVFALGVLEFADLALPVKPPHFVGGGHIAVVFAVGVNLPGALHRFHQLHRLGGSLDRQHLRKDVLARLHGPDGEGRVLVGVVGQHHSVHVVLNKGIEIVVIGDAAVVVQRLLTGDALFPFVADGDDLGMVCLLAVVDHAAAASHAHDTDADLFHRLFLLCPRDDLPRLVSAL